MALAERLRKITAEADARQRVEAEAIVPRVMTWLEAEAATGKKATAMHQDNELRKSVEQHYAYISAVLLIGGVRTEQRHDVRDVVWINFRWD
jgi:hypothetical protein